MRVNVKHIAKIKQHLIIIYASFLAFFFAIEAFLAKDALGEGVFFYARALLGGISAIFIFFMVLHHKLLKKWDLWVLFSFFVYVFLVTYFYYGFSFRLLACSYYYTWLNLIFLSLTFRTAKEPDAVLRPVSFVFVFTVSLIECFVLVHATLSLKTAILGSDRVLGCFKVGRLCGLGNANTISFYAITAALFATLQCLKAGKKARVFWGVALILQWFVMGLSNCRTTIIAFTFTCALYVLTRIRKRGMEKKGRDDLKNWIVAILASGFVGILLMGSFLLPTPLYKGGVMLAAKATGDQQVIDNLSLVYERGVTDVETLTDRQMVWKRSLELCLKNPRRTLFGISIKSSEPVHGAYEGRHDIPLGFAHNGFLEMFRVVGFAGCCFWIVLLCVWGWNAIKICFDVRTDKGNAFMMAVGAGTLLTGMTEYGPFSYGIAIAVPLAFVISCGYCMRGNGNEEA